MQVQSEQIDLLVQALIVARKHIPPIPRNMTVKVESQKGSYTFSYADFPSICEKINPCLMDAGLEISQGSLFVDGQWMSETTLIHTSGQWRRCYIPLLGATNMQGLGSALYYAQRYGVRNILRLPTDDDDDANIADGNTMERVVKSLPSPRKIEFLPGTKYIGTLSKVTEPKERRPGFLEFNVEGNDFSISFFKLPDGVTKEMLIPGEVYQFSFTKNDKGYMNPSHIALVPKEFRELIELRNKIDFSIDSLVAKTKEDKEAVYQRFGHTNKADIKSLQDANEILEWLKDVEGAQ